MPNPENIKGHSFADKPEKINRKGRPKGKAGFSMTKTLREYLLKDGSMIIESVYEVDENRKETGKFFKRARVRIPQKDLIVINLLRKAAKGDAKTAEMVFDRIDGKVTLPISVSRGEDPQLDFTKLTDGERKTFLKLFEKAKVKELNQ